MVFLRQASHSIFMHDHPLKIIFVLTKPPTPRYIEHRTHLNLLIKQGALSLIIHISPILLLIKVGVIFAP